MGWFWGSSNNDPVKKLDPGLRDYLQHEAPKEYVPASPSSQDHPKPTESSPSREEPAAPSKSLYQDGRYAHLWKTYKPPPEDGVEQRGAERVIEKYKSRNDTVHRAAMENCALEQEALTYCFQTGNWQKRLQARVTLCSEENAKFSRCFTTQSKFLQALGYASSFQEDEAREERIQMHADKLYHQMLDYEAQVEACKKTGQDPPPLTSLFNPQGGIPDEKAIPAGFRPSKPMEQLTPHERELEIRSHNAALQQTQLYAQEASPFMKKQDDARDRRREKAVSWFGETVGKWIS